MWALRKGGSPLRRHAGPLVVLLALLAFSGQAQAAWVTTFCDYFDSDATGGHPINWTTHEQSPPATNVSVDNTRYHGSAGKSVKFVDNSTTWGCWIERGVTPAQTQFALEWWQQMDSTLDGLDLVVVGSGPVGSSNFRPFSAVGLDSTRWAYTGWFTYTDAGGEHGIAAFAPQAWYKIRFEMNCATQTFNVYIWNAAGTLAHQILNAVFPTTMNALTSYHLKAGGPSQTPYGAWVDDVCEQTWEAGAPPQTWITSGPCGQSICPGNVTICFSGSDDSTPVSSLRYYWRLDAGPWQGGTTSVCAPLGYLYSGAHLFEVYAVDGDGNADPSPAQCSFSIDSTGPSVLINSPYSGQTVKCTVRISATASDASGVQRVVFYARGQHLYSDYWAPYEYDWDTRPTSVYDGPASILAVAYDSCGNYSQASVTVNVDNTTFSDVAKTDWHWLYVETITARGITSGCAVSPPRYCPYDNVTRAQMAVFLCKVAGKGPLYRETPTFCDVPKSDPYYGWIERLADPESWGGNPPTIGCAVYPCRMYCPRKYVLREEMAAFIVRAAGKLPMSSCAGVFCDVSTSSWACGYIARLADAGSWSCGAPTTGVPCPVGYPSWCRCYSPRSYVSRAQMAAFLVRAFCVPQYCSG